MLRDSSLYNAHSDFQFSYTVDFTVDIDECEQLLVFV